MQLSSFDSVVDVLGGPTEVGRLTGNFCSAVLAWEKRSGQFPAKHYLIIKSELADRGYWPAARLFTFSTPISVYRKKLEKAA